jgi:hypothetical protein
VDGGAPFTMTHIGLVVRPPNCARYTREGMNEIEGLAPDRVVAISQLAREDAAAAVLAAIRATP